MLIEGLQNSQRQELQLIDLGWHVIDVNTEQNPFKNLPQHLSHWLQTQCEGQYYNFYGIVYFENEDDFIAFRLQI